MTGDPRILEGSFRDPSGFVFVREGTVYRQVNRRYQADYDRLMSSGLYDELVGRGLLIAHRETADAPFESSSAYKIIRPDPLAFVSYPYEWSFGALKEAALTTLSAQRSALARGMTLKDASAFNVQFFGARPLLIDTLSFETLAEGRPWAAYGQFCRHFLAPLAVTAGTGQWLNSLLATHLDGLPLDMAAALLPVRSRFRPSLLSHIHFHAAAIRRSARRPDPFSARRRPLMGMRALMGLTDHLESAIRRLAWKKGRTAGWSDYYGRTSYSRTAFEAKKAFVVRALETIRPASVWDLGANTGEFSRLASERGIFTVSVDGDPACVEETYRSAWNVRDAKLLPLVVDVANPSPGLGWEGLEREPFAARGPADMVLALALVHHLSISRNIPLAKVARFLGRICRWLVIEFVPKGDPQVDEMLALREDIYEDYTERSFESILGRSFEIVGQERIPETPRTLYLMKNRSGKAAAAPSPGDR